MTYPPALPKWEGGWSRDGFVDFLCKEVLASPPWGRRERGKMSKPCQSKTSSQVKPSPKKNSKEQKNCVAT
jgi:hypothetical protein